MIDINVEAFRIERLVAAPNRTPKLIRSDLPPHET
jgi:hypothetical protein